ncbi:TlpA family protein disulfide reductase [Spirosoma utsteinense]|uniref:Thiol-disulfide isomerase/thioredoxin n=1 Tax=Spirosoma utsteinense TaxID=2585773 RepID=A0ABR6WAJ7_9BACT|nr:TlpA family protein disulfide reductase [Spirosoma utsteinense]MBC3787270.1 thiol-disulfide isomerase/thioredoxin [Spirosoma utsteinense]MBC3792956.1 thiol-disulfide isomerase/thioredoxin [Spirosoma utsteinense]
MKKPFLTALAGLLLISFAWAQSPSTKSFKITGRVNGLKDTTLVLAHYFGATQYIPQDTARVDGAGNFMFEGAKQLPTGLYLVVSPKIGNIELLMDNDQAFSFETDTGSVIKKMKVTGSAENELFYGYQQQLGQLMEDAQALNVQRKLRTDATSTAMFNEQMSILQKKAQSQREQFFKDNSNTFAVKLLKASAEPNVPPAPKAANGRPDSVWVFNYFKSHFWDDYDFADDRFVRSPILQRKLDRYLKELTVQNADSLIKEADFLVGKAVTGKSKEVKAYTIWYITSQYEQPKVMGTDGLYVHMFEKYYATGVMPVSDTATVRKIGERVATLKPTLVGKILVSPTVSDTLRRPIALSAIKSDYTIVYFYAPHCGHCRDSAPKLKKFIDDYKGKGVEVLAIPVEDSPDEWKKFIREFKLQKALNGYDYASRTNYRQQYDVWTTPTLYVLDKNKKIIARKLPVEQLEDFVLFHKKQQAAQKTSVATVKAK